MLQLFLVNRPPPESLPKFSTPRCCKVRPAGEKAEDSGEEELGDLGRLVVRERAAASVEEEMRLGSGPSVLLQLSRVDSSGDCTEWYAVATERTICEIADLSDFVVGRRERLTSAGP